MAKVSVVIPEYGVEPYFEWCARSLFGQTLDEMEYIFVNDCTSDRSIDVLNLVLDEYPQRQEYVRITNQPQNMVWQKPAGGIKAATGEYIICYDSDNWVSAMPIDGCMTVQSTTTMI